MIFKDAFMNYPLILLITDIADGKIIAANNKAKEVYGYSLDQLKNMTLMDLNKLSPEKVKKEMKEIKNNNYFTFPHFTSTGEIILMDIQSLTIIIDDKEALISFIYPCKHKKYLNN